MKKVYTVKEAEEVAEKIGIEWSKVDFDLAQFLMGMNVEAEHGAADPQTNVTNDDAVMTGKIAWAHLKEIKDYYDRLKVMEGEVEN